MLFFFFNDTATTEIYTLSLHDALPISPQNAIPQPNFVPVRLSTSRSTQSRGISGLTSEGRVWDLPFSVKVIAMGTSDRKSTRLNSSHGYISYAVFCLKKKKHSSYIHHH